MIVTARRSISDVGEPRSPGWKVANDSLPVVPSSAVPLDPLVLGSAMPSCLVDRNLRYVLLNEAMAEVHGLPAGKIKGRWIADFFPDAVPALGRWFELADVGRPLPDRQAAWRGRHYQVAARPVRSAILGVHALSLAACDVTRRVRFERRLRASRERLVALACHDDLTGLLNRRGLEAQLHRELRRARREQQPLSLLMIDIDRFKVYNDHCGHLQGDSCLRAVSTVLRQSMRRPGDVAGRFGGEEFVAVLPGIAESGAELVAERLRAVVESLRLRHPASDAPHVTVSVGVASLRIPQDRRPTGHYRAALMEAADRALYRAKAAGRNRVEGWAVDLGDSGRA